MNTSAQCAYIGILTYATEVSVYKFRRICYTPSHCRGGGIGRRDGFKTHWPKGLESSILSRGTEHIGYN